MLPSCQTLRVGILQGMQNTNEYLRKTFGAKGRKGGQAGEMCVMRGSDLYCLLTYCEGVELEDEMRGLRGTHCGEEKDTEFWWGNLKERDNWEYLRVDGKILKWSSRNTVARGRLDWGVLV